MAELRVKGTGTIKLFESDNTSSVTIASPSSLSANKTITLPDADVTLVSGTMATTNGITEFDQWRITANLALSSSGRTVMTANWERSDTNFEVIGTGMSESSGIFTFPSTGKWLVTCNQMFSSSTDMSYCFMEIQNTTDDSTYDRIARGVSPSSGDGEDNHSACFSTMIDITNVSNDKVCFSAYRGGSVTFIGGSDAQNTGATFMKLGDT